MLDGLKGKLFGKGNAEPAKDSSHSLNAGEERVLEERRVQGDLARVDRQVHVHQRRSGVGRGEVHGPRSLFRQREGGPAVDRAGVNLIGVDRVRGVFRQRVRVGVRGRGLPVQ